MDYINLQEPDINADIIQAKSCEKVSCRRVADHAVRLKDAAVILKSYAIQQQQQQNHIQSTSNESETVWNLKRRLESAENSLSRARAGCVAMQRQVEAGLSYRREVQQLKSELNLSQEALLQYKILLEEGNRFRNDLRTELDQARKAASVARADLAKEQRLHCNTSNITPASSTVQAPVTFERTARWLEAQEEENAKLRCSVRSLAAREIGLSTKLEEVRSCVEKECLRLTVETPRTRKRTPHPPAISNVWFLSLAGILDVPAPPLPPTSAATAQFFRKPGRPKEMVDQEESGEDPQENSSLILNSVLKDLDEVNRCDKPRSRGPFSQFRQIGFESPDVLSGGPENGSPVSTPFGAHAIQPVAVTLANSGSRKMKRAKRTSHQRSKLTSLPHARDTGTTPPDLSNSEATRPPVCARKVTRLSESDQNSPVKSWVAVDSETPGGRGSRGAKTGDTVTPKLPCQAANSLAREFRKQTHRIRSHRRLLSEASSTGNEEEKEPPDASQSIYSGIAVTPPLYRTSQPKMDNQASSHFSPLATSVDLDAEFTDTQTAASPSLVVETDSVLGVLSSPILRPSSPPHYPASPTAVVSTTSLVHHRLTPPPATRPRKRAVPIDLSLFKGGRVQTRPSALGGAKRPKRCSNQIQMSLTQMITEGPRYSKAVVEWFIQLTSFEENPTEEEKEEEDAFRSPIKRFQVINSRSLIKATKSMTPDEDMSLVVPLISSPSAEKNDKRTEKPSPDAKPKPSIPLGSCVGMASGLLLKGSSSAPSSQNSYSCLNSELIAYFSCNLDTLTRDPITVPVGTIPPALLRVIADEPNPFSPAPPCAVGLAVALLRASPNRLSPADFAAWFHGRRKLPPAALFRLAQVAFLSNPNGFLLYPLSIAFATRGYPLGCLLLASGRTMREASLLDLAYRRLISEETDVPDIVGELRERGWWVSESTSMKDIVSKLADSVLLKDTWEEEAALALRLVLTVLGARHTCDTSNPPGIFGWLLKGRLLPWINSLATGCSLTSAVDDEDDGSPMVKLLRVTSLAIDVILVMAQIDNKPSPKRKGGRRTVSKGTTPMSPRLLVAAVDRIFELLTGRLQGETAHINLTTEKAIFNVLRLLPCLSGDQIGHLTDLFDRLPLGSRDFAQHITGSLPPSLFPGPHPTTTKQLISLLNIPASSRLAHCWLQCQLSSL